MVSLGVMVGRLGLDKSGGGMSFLRASAQDFE